MRYREAGDCAISRVRIRSSVVLDLAGGDLETAHLLHDPGEAARALSLEIHDVDIGFEGKASACTFLQQGCAEEDACGTRWHPR
jgi:hypothetical protein